jgi:hypothetical protein
LTKFAINKYLFKHIFLYSLILVFVSACEKKQYSKSAAKVYINKKDGKYTLYKEGKPFYIKGASGNEHFELLAQHGGNTIRYWDTIAIEKTLNLAQKHKLSVIIGFPMPFSKFDYYYNDKIKIKAQYNAFKRIVNKYKNHPSLLMWCLGNELKFPLDLKHEKFYKQYNSLVTMIHENDPDHPVITSTDVKADLIGIKLRTDIDVIAFNLFGNLKSFRKDAKWVLKFWNGPYMITEWANDGPWGGTKQTAWGAYYEPNSTIKAQIFKERYISSMPIEDPKFLGSLMFYWGQKQETTPTWFSLFDKYGAKTETVCVAEYLWKGKKIELVPPQIDQMFINGKTTLDNILLNSGSRAKAQLILKNETNIKLIRWEIYKEDWFIREDYKHSKPVMVKSFSSSGAIKKVIFNAPQIQGPYRFFISVYDNNGNVANCNTPFYVLDSENEKH